MPAPTNGDPNAINLAQYKGEVRKCEYCKPEEVLLGRACQWCLSQGYLAKCTNCNGTGKVGGPSVWDGGRSQYVATCAPCGGKGCFPARSSEFAAQQGSVPPSNGQRRVPIAVSSMKELGITRR